MIIIFDKKGNNFLDIHESKSKNNVVIILSSQDGENSLKTIVNSVEISKKEFRKIINNINMEEDNASSTTSN